MEFILIIIIILFAIYYISQVSNILFSHPLFAPVFRVKFTLVFGTVAFFYYVDHSPLPLSNIFLGMIAGSFIDYILLQDTKK